MNELHLFAGAGGGILGGMLLEHTCVCAVEIDPYCRKVLLQRQRDGILPKFPIWDDVRTFDGKPWAERSTSSVAASRARTYLAQGKEQELKESEADCGLNLQESLAKYDPATRLWRTRQCSLFEVLGECLETFPKSGMMQDGVLWELTTWAPRTSEKECGFWRTPDAGAGGEISDEKAADYAAGKPRKSGSAIQIRLCDQVRHRKLWPTPKCQDSRTALRGRGKSNSGQVVHGGVSCTWWGRDPADQDGAFESQLGRVADGVANRVDRLKAIGNGQVPLVAAAAFRLLKGNGDER